MHPLEHAGTGSDLPRRGWRRLMVGLSSIAMMCGLIAGCTSDSVDEASTRTQYVTVTEETSDGPAPAPGASAPARTPARRTGSFTGPFASSDSLQLCQASTIDVVCLSTVSGQEVWLGPSGARYVGIDGSGVTVLDADPLGASILTPAGIACDATSRGIECLRGGHGFVIGDTALIVLRGPNETRFVAEDLSTEPVPPDLSAYDSVDSYVADLAIGCDDFLFRNTAQETLDVFPEMASSLDDDGNGIACEDLPDSYDLGTTSYLGVDLGDETETDVVAGDGLWAQTCPGGSCYGAPSSANGLPRTTYVRGYTRADGTYVGAHYRSSP